MSAKIPGNPRPIEPTLQLVAESAFFYVAPQQFYIALHNERGYKSGAPGPPIPSNHLPGRLIEVKA